MPTFEEDAADGNDVGGEDGDKGEGGDVIERDGGADVDEG